MKDARSWAANLFVGFVVLVAVGFALAGVVSAALIPITNAGFEDPILADGGYVNGTASGWTVTGNAGTFNPTTEQIPLNSTQVGYSNNTSGDAFSQNLSAVLVADTTYTLQVDIYSRIDGDAGPNQSSILQLRTSSGFVLATTTIDFPIPAPGTTVTQTTTFTALGSDIHIGDTLQVALLSAGAGNQSDWDNVRLDATAAAAVPEPTTLLLWGTTAVGLAIVRRRRARRSVA